MRREERVIARRAWQKGRTMGTLKAYLVPRTTPTRVEIGLEGIDCSVKTIERQQLRNCAHAGRRGPIRSGAAALRKGEGSVNTCLETSRGVNIGIKKKACTLKFNWSCRGENGGGTHGGGGDASREQCKRGNVASLKDVIQ